MIDQSLTLLFGGVAIFLVIVSIIGFIVSLYVKGDNARSTVGNLNARVRAWWIMAVIFAIAFCFGNTVTLILFALTSFYCLREFITLTPTRAADYRPVAAAFYLFLPLQYYSIGISWQSVFSIAIPVYGFLLLPVLSVFKGDTFDFLQRTSKVQWGLMLMVYCISHAPALLLLNIPNFEGRNVLLLFFLFTVVQISDVLQYVFGKLFGRWKVAPNVNPAKTWEGLIGGGLSATAAGAWLSWITPFTPLQAAVISFVVVVAGFCGGLVLSAVKRSLGAKDWGAMIAGHGGTLDRMDSVAFAALIFFHLTNYFFVP
jgi:phosphatidate cytidylyltransferase